MGRGVPVAMEEVEQMEALYATGLSSNDLYSSSEDSTRCVRKYNAVAGVLSRRGRV
jgi:hypothetical protein